MRYILLILMLLVISCASTPEGADAGSAEDETWVADESGLDVENGDDGTQADTDSQNENADSTTTPQDAITELENNRADELFDGSSPLSSLSSSEYRTYNNTRFEYRAAIPVSWYINEAVISSTGVTTVKRDSATIRVKSYKPANGDQEAYNRRALSEIEKKDATYRTIIENREIQMLNGNYATLMVHEYTKSRVRYLRRTVTLVSENNAYIISCEAPTSSFYRNEDAFNTFFRSFQARSAR